ncbi:hypothetical protein PFICI_11704 [Pestalotiopsis fici W106-1]|uniref:Uncharacterized protein n=1 Tax=Pestalotiopsis fici (strain W106-1 / CGMCC3.15140) TaxID=1229662 RepID=W3WT57_PESFW|nr:uncharacterized protein PFICI_11704 [Pestalotiopsis fici W106-1]ETS76317.1 hypothetical protein PFICI_11704 [Pestalotiopsis fici W106-1]
MSRQLSQNQDLSMAKALQAEFAKNRSSSGNGRGGSGGSRGRRGGSPMVPSRVSSHSNTVPMFSASSYTARQGVGISFPGRGGFSPAAAASVTSSSSSYRQEHQPPSQINRQENQPISHTMQSQLPVQDCGDTSTSHDIEMSDGEVTSSTQNLGQKLRVSKHGGMEQSRWAQTGRPEVSGRREVSDRQDQAAEFDRRMKNWIPTHVAHPTPSPSHLAQDIQSRSQTMYHGTTPTSHGNVLDADQRNASSVGTRRVAPNGGMASSQWAN